MRIIIIWLPLLLLVLATEARAQTYLWIEPQIALESWESHMDSTKCWGPEDFGAKTGPRECATKSNLKTGEYFGTISFGHQWKPWLGLFAQTAHGNLWGETVVGPSFQLGKSLNVGIGAGVEHYTSNPMRLRLNAYYDHESTGSFAYVQFDTNKDSSWYWVDTALMLNKNTGLGILVQMPGGGAGPKFELRGEHLGLWIAPVYEWQERKFRTLVGGRLMWQN